jgi:response regulator RpfG family c-di-GMP phosphodiesterase
LLELFGAVADAAAGEPPDAGTQIASLAGALAELDNFSSPECDALYWAAILRNLGALGNAALRSGDRLPEREAMTARWDIPAQGARLIETIGVLPDRTADFVRWQAECWDGTGFPDQLRWLGIPAAAQTLHVAIAYATSRNEPEETLAAMVASSGRGFSPERARVFVRWFHTYGGEIAPRPAPADSLRRDAMKERRTFELLADRVDEHNGTPNRWRRVGALAVAVAGALAQPAENANGTVEPMAMLFGIGEIAEQGSDARRFDPLARLGIAPRAANAVAAAEVIAGSPLLHALAPQLRAIGEWYDGTGRPDALRHEAIPVTAQIVAACIAYDELAERARSRAGSAKQSPIEALETAAGTQFDPVVIRALAKCVRVRA